MTVEVAAATERVVDLPGRGIGVASETLVALGQRRGYTVGAVGPGAFRLERAVRPIWATALGIVTMPLLGLGLVFLRVRKRESAMVTIYEDRTGTKARIVGQLDSEIAAHLAVPPQATNPPVARSAPAEPAPAEPAQPGPQPVHSPPDGFASSSQPSSFRGSDAGAVDAMAADVSKTVARPSRGPAPASPTLRASGSRTVALLHDGTEIDLRSAVVLGRRPAADDSARTVPISDPSLSKSHVRLEPTTGGVLVTDLHSTNGVRVRANGAERLCEPGRPVVVAVGASMFVGEVEVRLVEVAT